MSFFKILRRVVSSGHAGGSNNSLLANTHPFNQHLADSFHAQQVGGSGDPHRHPGGNYHQFPFSDQPFFESRLGGRKKHFIRSGGWRTEYWKYPPGQLQESSHPVTGGSSDNWRPRFILGYHTGRMTGLCGGNNGVGSQFRSDVTGGITDRIGDGPLGDLLKFHQQLAVLQCFFAAPGDPAHSLHRFYRKISHRCFA